MKKIIFICLAIGLIGCGKSQEEIRLEQEAQQKALEQERLKKIEQKRIEQENKIKELIKKDLLDPVSALFTFQKSYSKRYCGTVNSKNRFGGYVGDKRFIATEYGYSIDDHHPSDDAFSQILNLNFEREWVRECEGVKPKEGVSLKECEQYSEMALIASHSYVNRSPEIPFNVLKRINLKVRDNPKYLSEFFDAVKKLNPRESDQDFPMVYATMNYESCLQGDMSY